MTKETDNEVRINGLTLAETLTTPGGRTNSLAVHEAFARARGEKVVDEPKTQGEPNMTDDDVKWVGALVDCAYKSWAVRLAEASPPNTANFAPSWDDVDRLVAEIIKTIESSAALRWAR
jgi:hypothetical protein